MNCQPATSAATQTAFIYTAFKQSHLTADFKRIAKATTTWAEVAKESTAASCGVVSGPLRSVSKLICHLSAINRSSFDSNFLYQPTCAMKLSQR